eukprot:197929-Hanusia_phi.AAC.2
MTKTFEFVEKGITTHACFVNEDTLFSVSSTRTNSLSKASQDDTTLPTEDRVDVLSTWIHLAAQEIGGVTQQLNKACITIEQRLSSHLPPVAGARAICGMIVFGPSGVGKTCFVNAVLRNAPYRSVKANGSELYAADRGATEGKIISLFKEAFEASPCILFIDEVRYFFTPLSQVRRSVKQIDAIGSRASRGSDKENKYHVEQRAAHCLLSCLESLRYNENLSERKLFVIGATNRFDVLDEQIISAGRLESWLPLPVPTSHARQDILKASDKHGDEKVRLEDFLQVMRNIRPALLRDRATVILPLTASGPHSLRAASRLFNSQCCLGSIWWGWTRSNLHCKRV